MFIIFPEHVSVPWTTGLSSGCENSVIQPLITESGSADGDISEIITPVSEPILLATICSTTDRLSVAPPPTLSPVTNPTDTSEGSVMLQNYLKERAVQDLKIKQQYQSPHIKVDQHDFEKKFSAYTEAFQMSATGLKVTPVDRSDDVPTTLSPKRKNQVLYENDTQENVYTDKDKLKIERTNDVDSKENFVLTSDSEKNDCSASVIILVGSPNSGCNNSPKKLKAEFISPCNGPLPKYAR